MLTGRLTRMSNNAVQKEPGGKTEGLASNCVTMVTE